MGREVEKSDCELAGRVKDRFSAIPYLAAESLARSELGLATACPDNEFFSHVYFEIARPANLAKTIQAINLDMPPVMLRIRLWARDGLVVELRKLRSLLLAFDAIRIFTEV